MPVAGSISYGSFPLGWKILLPGPTKFPPGPVDPGGLNEGGINKSDLRRISIEFN